MLTHFQSWRHGVCLLIRAAIHFYIPCLSVTLGNQPPPSPPFMTPLAALLNRFGKILGSEKVWEPLSLYCLYHRWWFCNTWGASDHMRGHRFADLLWEWLLGPRPWIIPQSATSEFVPISSELQGCGGSGMSPTGKLLTSCGELKKSHKGKWMKGSLCDLHGGSQQGGCCLIYSAKEMMFKWSSWWCKTMMPVKVSKLGRFKSPEATPGFPATIQYTHVVFDLTTSATHSWWTSHSHF